jgi:hypothetical protein
MVNAGIYSIIAEQTVRTLTSSLTPGCGGRDGRAVLYRAEW